MRICICMHLSIDLSVHSSIIFYHDFFVYMYVLYYVHTYIYTYIHELDFSYIHVSENLSTEWVSFTCDIVCWGAEDTDYNKKGC